MRNHVLEPSTKEIRWTFGVNHEVCVGTLKIESTHLYNPITKKDLVFGQGNRFKSGWKTN